MKAGKTWDDDKKPSFGQAVNFNFSWKVIRHEPDPKTPEEARRVVENTPLAEILWDVLSPVILETMVDRGFECVSDIWPDSSQAIKRVPSYGKVKDGRAQAKIKKYYKEVRKGVERQQRH